MIPISRLKFNANLLKICIFALFIQIDSISCINQHDQHSNDHLWYITKEGFESSVAPQSFHQNEFNLEHFRDFSTLVRHSSSSKSTGSSSNSWTPSNVNPTYDDNIKEESIVRYSIIPENSVLDPKSKASNINRSQGAKTNVAKAVMFGARTKPLRSSYSLPSSTSGSFGRVNGFKSTPPSPASSTRNHIGVKQPQTSQSINSHPSAGRANILITKNIITTLVPVDEVTTSPSSASSVDSVDDVDYLNNFDDGYLAQSDHSNHSAVNHLWDAESQQVLNFTSTQNDLDTAHSNTQSQNDAGRVLGLNLNDYKSSINYSSIFSSYNSPGLTIDPFKVFEQSSTDDKIPNNIFAKADQQHQSPVRSSYQQTDSVQPVGQYHNGAITTSTASDDTFSYGSSSVASNNPVFSPTVGISTDHVLNSNQKSNTAIDAPSSADYSWKSSSANGQQSGSKQNPPPVDLWSNSGTYDRNAAYEYLQTVLQDTNSQKSQYSDSPKLPADTSKQTGEYHQAKPVNSVQNGPLFDYKLSEDFYQPKAIPEKYLSKKFTDFSNSNPKPDVQQSSDDGLGLKQNGYHHQYQSNSVQQTVSDSKWKGISDYESTPIQQPYSNSAYSNSNTVAIKPLLATSVVGKANNSQSNVVRLVPQANVEVVPLPPPAEYDVPEIIHSGDYVVRVEKVPLRNIQDAYYNATIPDDSISDSPVKSHNVTLVRPPPKTRKSSSVKSGKKKSGKKKSSKKKNGKKRVKSKTNARQEEDSSNEEKNDEEKSNADDVEDETSKENEEENTEIKPSSSEDKDESEVEKEEEEEEKKEESGDEDEKEKTDTSQEESDSSKEQDDEAEETEDSDKSKEESEDGNGSEEQDQVEDNGSSEDSDDTVNEDNEDDSDSGRRTTTTTTPAPPTTTTTPKPKYPPPPPFPLYPPPMFPPFMFPPMYPPPPYPGAGNGYPQMPPMPYPMPHPSYMPYGPQMPRPSYGPPKPYGYGAKPYYPPPPPYTPPAKPAYQSSPPPSSYSPPSKYSPPHSSITYQQIPPIQPNYPPQYPPKTYQPAPVPQYDKPAAYQQPTPPPYYPPPSKYPSQQNSIGGNYPAKKGNYYYPNEQYTNEITKTITISSDDSPKKPYGNYYYRRGDQQSQQYPQQYQSNVPSYPSPYQPNAPAYTPQYQPNTAAYPKAPNNDYETNSDINADIYLSDLVSGYSSKPQYNSKPANYAPSPYSSNSLNSVTTPDQSLSNYHQMQPYTSTPSSEKKFSLGNFKKGLKKLLPKLRYSSGDPYPPALDSYYRPLMGNFDPNDPMSEFWNHLDNSNQPKPVLYNCDQNRVGKCVLPSGQPLQQTQFKKA